ncbi:MAG: DUF5658 family protein [Chloroflexota bacterium]
MGLRRLAWPGLLAGAQLTDVASTWLGLRFGVPEENPVLPAVLANGDFLLFLVVKLLLVAALLVLVAGTGRRLRTGRAVGLTVQALTVGFTAVAALNRLVSC